MTYPFLWFRELVSYTTIKFRTWYKCNKFIYTSFDLCSCIKKKDRWGCLDNRPLSLWIIRCIVHMIFFSLIKLTNKVHLPLLKSIFESPFLIYCSVSTNLGDNIQYFWQTLSPSHHRYPRFLFLFLSQITHWSTI